jgi:hypothetical protein
VQTVGARDEQLLAPARRSRVRVWVFGTLYVLVGTIIQLPRQSGTPMWRTVWAEDGSIFFVDALQHPLRSTIFEPYAGYALVVPRILASVGVHLPHRWFGPFVVVTASLIAALLSLFVYFASAPLLRSSTRQAVLAAALLLWPVLPLEVSGTISNLQWLMPTACLLAVLFPVEGGRAIVVRLVVVVVAPLTSPICVVFVPIAAWRLVQDLVRRTWRARLLVPLAYLGASVVQLAVWITATKDPTGEPVWDTFLPNTAKLYSTKVATEMLFGVRVSQTLWDRWGYWLAVGSVVLLAALLVIKVWRSSPTSRVFVLSCVIASAALFAFSMWQRAATIDGMLSHNGLPQNFNAPRYELFPSALLLLALLVPTDLRRGTFTDPFVAPPRSLMDDVRSQQAVVVVAVLWLLVAFVPSYRLTNGRSPGPDWITEVSEAERACAIAPADTQTIEISPAPIWMIEVPCSELDD